MLKTTTFTGATNHQTKVKIVYLHICEYSENTPNARKTGAIILTS